MFNENKIDIHDCLTVVTVDPVAQRLHYSVATMENTK